MTPTNILLVDDAEKTGTATKRKLEEAGFNVEYCKDGGKAWTLFQSSRFDICLIDIIMPVMDGLTLTYLIRGVNPHIPILLLTSLNQKEDRINGLRQGADDYIIKPFSMRELILRINVFIRRTALTPANIPLPSVFHIGQHTFYYEQFQLLNNNLGLTTRLTPKETLLLKYFCENSNKLLTLQQIQLAVWGNDDYFTGRSMSVFISRINSHLKSDPCIEIENLKGIGYRFKVRKSL
ncbi:response regulator transcription factor [Chitinophaga varians]|uniref:Response regulator transcription factor n=1 Tax=Chitinophaga varians TaxID=2202339 RepID=A0A847RXU5_9BACT|nr:response regulator transcription factor [Chitinophaga varians]NLR67882.1 response regulator transcription factor [Chitinophaga varians]